MKITFFKYDSMNIFSVMISVNLYTLRETFIIRDIPTKGQLLLFHR